MDDPGPELSWSLTGPPAMAAPALRHTYCPGCGVAAPAADAYCRACGTNLGPLEAAGTSAPDSADEAADSAATLRRAHYLLVTGDVHEAVPLLEGLVAAHPQWPSLRAYLGVAYIRVARVHEAQLAIEAALEQAPEDFTARMAYAEYYARLGFYDKAVRELDLALGVGSPGSEPYRAAFELRRYCVDKSKGLFYRQTVLPRWPKALRLRRTPRPAATAVTARSN